MALNHDQTYSLTPIQDQKDGVKMKIRPCNGDPSQEWYYNGENTFWSANGLDR